MVDTKKNRMNLHTPFPMVSRYNGFTIMQELLHDLGFRGLGPGKKGI